MGHLHVASPLSSKIQLPELQFNVQVEDGWQVTLLLVRTVVIDIEQLQTRVVEDVSKHNAPALHFSAHGLLVWRGCLFSWTIIMSEALLSPETRVVKFPSYRLKY